MRGLTFTFTRDLPYIVSISFTHVKITRQWKSNFTLNSYSLREIGSITSCCSGNEPALLFEKTYAGIRIAAVFWGRRGKTQHMLLVSNDISHFRRFVTMHKLNFELRHRHDRRLTRPAISSREGTRPDPKDRRKSSL